MIDRFTIDKILDAAEIVDVVSDFVTLKKSGANYKGLCPFHNDRTPSFMVSPAKNLCKCFSCGKGGTPVGFIMEHEQMTYPEALRYLANKYHIEIKEKELTPEERKQQTERESLFIVNDWAAKHFSDTLYNNIEGKSVGMAYFRSRGFRDDIIKKFQLGYDVGDRRAFAKAAKAAGYKDEYIQTAGICYKTEKGELLDRFAGRVIFPWLTLSGKVVAFGGRLLDSRTKGVAQKYVNSPDSPIYHKDQELYGIFQAKRAIAKEDRVYMVEGYTDVISMHQCGIENVVANSGTALSMKQISILHRLTSNITLLYDGDEAGIHAAMRGTDMLLSQDMNIKVLLLPDGDDPDSFARKHSAEEFREYVEKHQTDFIDFKASVMLKGVTDPVKRAEAVNSVLKSVSLIKDPVKRAMYISVCTAKLGLKETLVIDTINRFIKEEREQGRKEAEREQARAERAMGFPQGEARNQEIPEPRSFESSQPRNFAASNPQSSEAPNPRGPEAPTSPRSSSKIQSIERLIVQQAVRFGGVNLPLETPMPVAEYIYENLASDELSFSIPIYNTLLKESLNHCHNENFNSEQFFSRHADMEIHQAAMSLIMLPYELSKKEQEKGINQERLLQNVNHLLIDLRLQIVSEQLDEVKRLLLSATETQKATLQAQYIELRRMQADIASMVGRHV